MSERIERAIDAVVAFNGSRRSLVELSAAILEEARAVKSDPRMGVAVDLLRRWSAWCDDYDDAEALRLVKNDTRAFLETLT